MDCTRQRTHLLQLLNRISTGVGAGVLFCMVALGSANMVLRSLGLPVTGTYELMGLGGAMIAALAMGGTQEARGHIQVNFFDQMLPGLLRRGLDAAASLVAALFFSLLAWRMFLLSRDLKTSGELSETLHLPYYPAVILVGLGFLGLVLNLLFQAWASLKGRGGEG
ncbi:TRAP transporter small permease [Desulfovermiculus halophilus]|jgi:TRAP-type C4-dicarboxylate transport system permease small subunit|uniref:TRAP transporter small permease n=1 Tax=Desulfovermiculus halophilus TaxID=339722 RepID=UPI000687E98E|nr:TRAP transporter small permease [Desulfovermiculus halophilus]